MRSRVRIRTHGSVRDGISVFAGCLLLDGGCDAGMELTDTSYPPTIFSGK